MDAGSADDPGPRPDDAAATQPVAVLEELLAAKGEHLPRTAVLLAGSRADGEDLLQAALERLFRRWRTIRGDPEGYLRRTLYHLAADGWRRNGAWRARLRLLGNPASVPDGTDAVDQRDQIIRLLSALPPSAAGENTAADWKQIIQDGLTCGLFTVAGRQWIDGVDAIKLTGHTPAAGTTIWVDSSSYLPVRLTGRVQLISGGTDAATLTIDFRWLPPTSANLKELTAPIPNGFREVSG
jgi:hypothetical protein